MRTGGDHHVRLPNASGDVAELAEGHALRFEGEGDEEGIVVIEVIGARRILESYGKITVTLDDGTVLRSPDVADHLRAQEAQAAEVQP